MNLLNCIIFFHKLSGTYGTVFLVLFQQNCLFLGILKPIGANEKQDQYDGRKIGDSDHRIGIQLKCWGAPIVVFSESSSKAQQNHGDRRGNCKCRLRVSNKN